MKTFITAAGFVLMCVPGAFLFHFYEYTQHLAGEEAAFLMPGAFIYLLVTGAAVSYVDLRWLISGLMVSMGLSLLLSNVQIAEDASWFAPFGRDLTVAVTACVFTGGVLMFRYLTRSMLAKRG
ncbi:hypothetical protein [Salibacterium halotolerans]|uniref:Uncharacterized protein n=1 Tax=Salibacterium halotolerans TaxID=1884432 RepID=A0A1I5S970_9BACI|nr:hypothetical protein [Salibacterium halotolerans]SFP67263.1 hypothetical protein SAMN05518683_10897 [Salibacterium halotolerans]